MAKRKESEGAGPFEVDPGQPFAPSEQSERATTDETGRETDLPPVAPVASDGLELLEVTEEQVRSLLMVQGAAVHGLAAVDKDSDEWVWLQAELDAIVPPLTRICNRYEPLRRAAALGDYPAVALGLGAYTRRSVSERAAALARLRFAEEAVPSSDADFRYAGP